MPTVVSMTVNPDRQRRSGVPSFAERIVVDLFQCAAVLITVPISLWSLYKTMDSLLSKRYNKVAVDSCQQEGGATSAIHNHFSYLCYGRYSLLLYL